MPNILDNSIPGPIENVHCWIHFLYYADIFPYCTVQELLHTPQQYNRDYACPIGIINWAEYHLLSRQSITFMLTALVQYLALTACDILPYRLHKNHNLVQ